MAKDLQHGHANRHRGEIEAVLGGTHYRLCLTLGALAELEMALGAGDLMDLAARFEHGRLSARECIAILSAGLRGAGHDMSDEQVAGLSVDGGAAGYARIVAELLEATFAPPGGATDRSEPRPDPREAP
ncbi:MAG: gene transfer agent family protein [Pseudomonadota bacterium]